MKHLINLKMHLIHEGHEVMSMIRCGEYVPYSKRKNRMDSNYTNFLVD